MQTRHQLELTLDQVLTGSDLAHSIFHWLVDMSHIFVCAICTNQYVREFIA